MTGDSQAGGFRVGSGRKNRDGGTGQSIMISLRTGAARKEAYKAAADLSNLDLTSWVFLLCDKAAAFTPSDMDPLRPTEPNTSTKEPDMSKPADTSLIPTGNTKGQVKRRAASQSAFPTAISAALNAEPRCPCLLLLDTSTSMAGAAIEQLNAGLRSFQAELMADPLAAKRVELAIVTFGPAQVVQPFVGINHLETTPRLVAHGDTPLGAAITLGLELLAKRKQEIREQLGSNGLYRPWVFLITDGGPTDNWSAAAEMIRNGEENKSFSFFAVGVEAADMKTLAQISTRQPIKLKGLMFKEMFKWLSDSLHRVSQSTPNTKVALQTPTGWLSID